MNAALCVLSSSSSGNCSALIVNAPGGPGVILIDAGLSPRRTRAMLEVAGLGDVPVLGMVLTHLDADHWHPGWVEARDEQVRLWVHRRHRGRAEREGAMHRRAEIFDGVFSPAPDVEFAPMLCAHDELGAAAFRVSLPGGATLGYATDVGRPSDELAAHLAGVDVLAVESNYCPRMQEASGRPAFLVRRIMGGGGHLSNQQSANLAFRAAPTRHIVLLHLSRQCNTPEAALGAYEGCPLPITVSGPETPTAHIAIERGTGRGPAMPAVEIPRMRQAMLWG